MFTEWGGVHTSNDSAQKVNYEGKRSIDVSGRLAGTVIELVVSLTLTGAWESGDPSRMLKIQSHSPSYPAKYTLV